MRKQNLVALAAALAFSATAAAESPKWTFIEGNFWAADASEGDGVDENTALGVFGSLGFAGIGHVQAAYSDGEVEGSGGNPDADTESWFIRLGAHPELNATTDLIVDIFYRDVEVEDDSCDGYGFRTGARSHALSDKVEVMSAVTWSDLDCDAGLGDDVTDFGFEAGGQYFWTPNVSTGIAISVNDLGASVGDGSDAVRFFIRGSFADLIQ